MFKSFLCLALAAVLCLTGEANAAVLRTKTVTRTTVRGAGARQLAPSVQQTTIINNGVGASLGVQHSFQRQRSFGYASASFSQSYSYQAPAAIFQAPVVYQAPVVQQVAIQAAPATYQVQAAPVVLQTPVYSAPVLFDVAPGCGYSAGASMTFRQRTYIR